MSRKPSNRNSHRRRRKPSTKDLAPKHNRQFEITDDLEAEIDAIVNSAPKMTAEDLKLTPEEEAAHKEAMESVITAKHFLPDRPSWGDDLRQRILDRITVPIAPAKRQLYDGTKEAPFNFLATSWKHLDVHDVLTQEKFEQEELPEGIKSFVDHVNRLEEFRPMRIVTRPPTSFGVAYHDWLGEDMPFDLRCIIRFGNFTIPGAPDPEERSHGFEFIIATLIQKDSKCAKQITQHPKAAA